MSSVALKRGASPPRRKPAPVRPAAATVALPVSAPRLRRNIIITIAVLLLAIAGVAATLAGVPQQLGQKALQASAMAGLEVRHVEITGTHEMARLPIYQAVLPGRDNAMLTTDLYAIRSRLRALPWVADASVSRRLPDTLAITIVERRPVALWQYRQRLSAIDITGKPLTSDRLDRFAKLPLVVGAGANLRVRELLALTAAAPTLSPQVDAAVLVGERRWNLRFKTGETLALPDTPAAATAAFKTFARLDAEQSADRKLLGGRFERFDMRLPGKLIVGGPAVQSALEAAAKAAKTQKPTTI